MVSVQQQVHPLRQTTNLLQSLPLPCEPSTVTAGGQSQITVTAKVSDNVGVHTLSGQLTSDPVTPGTGLIDGTRMTLSRTGGNQQDGVWTSTFAIPSTLEDGIYYVMIKAVDGASLLLIA